MKNILFAGPSLYGLDLLQLIPNDWVVRPPIRRGDMDTLRFPPKEGGAVHIVDGTFHAFPAVGHKEIISAIKRGWEVTGLASLGAIRASELRDFGMQGFGQVYQQYIEHPEFRDDEVTQIHMSTPPYNPISEPLINIRDYLAFMVGSGRISKNTHDEIIKLFSSMWYGNRTLSLLKKLLETKGSDFNNQDFTACRVKQRGVRHYVLQKELYL